MKFALNLELFKPTRPLDLSLLLLIRFSRIAYAAMSPTEAQRRSVVAQTAATLFRPFLKTFYAVCSSPRLTTPWNSSEDRMKLSKFGGNFCERNVFLSLCWLSCEARVFVSSRHDVHATHKGNLLLFFSDKGKTLYLHRHACYTGHYSSQSCYLGYAVYLFIYLFIFLSDDWYRTSFWSLWKRHTKRSTAPQGHQNRGTPMVRLFALCP